MNGIFEIEIRGQKKSLVFNNYARVEISKLMTVDPADILSSISDLANKNHMLLMKLLVWAGHCGDCYRRKDTTDYTIEEIGEWIGDADDGELHRMFQVFLGAEGFDLPEDRNVVKKKMETENG